MNPYTEWTFKLLHDRTTRQAFLDGDFERAGLPRHLHDDFKDIDGEELQRAALKVAAQLHGILRQTFPEIFKAWGEITPDDRDGLELTLLYMNSPQYAATVNFAWRENDVPLPVAFPAFLEELSLGGEPVS